MAPPKQNVRKPFAWIALGCIAILVFSPMAVVAGTPQDPEIRDPIGDVGQPISYVQSQLPVGQDLLALIDAEPYYDINRTYVCGESNQDFSVCMKLANIPNEWALADSILVYDSDYQRNTPSPLPPLPGVGTPITWDDIPLEDQVVLRSCFTVKGVERCPTARLAHIDLRNLPGGAPPLPVESGEALNQAISDAHDALDDAEALVSSLTPDDSVDADEILKEKLDEAKDHLDDAKDEVPDGLVILTNEQKQQLIDALTAAQGAISEAQEAVEGLPEDSSALNGHLHQALEAASNAVTNAKGLAQSIPSVDTNVSDLAVALIDEARAAIDLVNARTNETLPEKLPLPPNLVQALVERREGENQTKDAGLCGPSNGAPGDSTMWVATEEEIGGPGEYRGFLSGGKALGYPARGCWAEYNVTLPLPKGGLFLRVVAGVYDPEANDSATECVKWSVLLNGEFLGDTAPYCGPSPYPTTLEVLKGGKAVTIPAGTSALRVTAIVTVGPSNADSYLDYLEYGGKTPGMTIGPIEAMDFSQGGETLSRAVTIPIDAVDGAGLPQVKFHKEPAVNTKECGGAAYSALAESYTVWARCVQITIPVPDYNPIQRAVDLPTGTLPAGAGAGFYEEPANAAKTDCGAYPDRTPVDPVYGDRTKIKCVLVGVLGANGAWTTLAMDVPGIPSAPYVDFWSGPALASSGSLHPKLCSGDKIDPLAGGDVDAIKCVHAAVDVPDWDTVEVARDLPARPQVPSVGFYSGPANLAGTACTGNPVSPLNAQNARCVQVQIDVPSIPVQTPEIAGQTIDPQTIPTVAYPQDLADANPRKLVNDHFASVRTLLGEARKAADENDAQKTAADHVRFASGQLEPVKALDLPDRVDGAADSTLTAVQTQLGIAATLLEFLNAKKALDKELDEAKSQIDGLHDDVQSLPLVPQSTKDLINGNLNDASNALGEAKNAIRDLPVDQVNVTDEVKKKIDEAKAAIDAAKGLIPDLPATTADNQLGQAFDQAHDALDQVADALGDLPIPDLDEAPPSVPSAPQVILFDDFRLEDSEGEEVGAGQQAVTGHVDVKANLIRMTVKKSFAGSPARGDFLEKFHSFSSMFDRVLDRAPNSADLSPQDVLEGGEATEFGRNYEFLYPLPQQTQRATSPAPTSPGPVGNGILRLDPIGPTEIQVPVGSVGVFQFKLCNAGTATAFGSLSASDAADGWRHDLSSGTFAVAAGLCESFFLTVTAVEGGADELRSVVRVSPQGQDAFEKEFVAKKAAAESQDTIKDKVKRKAWYKRLPGFEADLLVLALAAAALLAVARRRRGA